MRTVTIDDLTKESLPPLTDHRPPRGPFRTRREPRVSELRENFRRCWTDGKASVFFAGWAAPVYVPDRKDNSEYVNARDSDYELR